MSCNLNICWKALALLILLAFDNIASGQQRVIKFQPQSPKEAIEILEVRLKGGFPVQFGKPFTADDDWLEGLTVKVKNISPRPIIFIRLDLRFPETHFEGFPQAVSPSASLGGKVEYGQEPKQKNASKNPRLLNTGESAELVLGKDYYQQLRSSIRTLSKVKSINNAIMFTEEVMYADDTMWFDGHIYRHDPNEPNIWHRIPE